MFISHSKASVDGTQDFLMAFFLVRLSEEDWVRAGFTGFASKSPGHMLGSCREAVLFPLSYLFPTLLCLIITVPVNLVHRATARACSWYSPAAAGPTTEGKPALSPQLISRSWFLQGCCRVKEAAVGKLLRSVHPKLAVPGGDLLPIPPNFWLVFSHLLAVAILFCKHSSHLYHFWFQSGFTRLEIVLMWCTSFPIKANPCPPCQSKHSYKGSGITLTVNKIFFHIMLYRTHCCRHFLHLYYMVLLHLLVVQG